MRGKKSTLITTLAVVISIISLVSCVGVLRISNSVQGISIEEKEEWNVTIEELSKLVMDEGAIEILKEPSVEDYKINYGIKLNNAPSLAQFEFNIKNDGNVDAIVSDIVISGVQGYENNVSVSFSELDVGDIIKEGTFVQVKVLTNYNTQLTNLDGSNKLIELNDVTIDIVLEKIE